MRVRRIITAGTAAIALAIAGTSVAGPALATRDGSGSAVAVQTYDADRLPGSAVRAWAGSREALGVAHSSQNRGTMPGAQSSPGFPRGLILPGPSRSR
jgi:hypothetical protein